MKRGALCLSILFWAATLAAKPVSQGTVPVRIENDRLVFDGFTLSFQRTLRIPDDGKTYPLPPGLGSFPLYRVDQYAGKLPKKWVEEGGVFLPMYQKEAMWIAFGGEEWRPRAVKIGIGKINVLTGEPWAMELKPGKEQDYLVAPAPQPWIDGIKAGKNMIRQFVAMPLGKGYTVEAQVTGKEEEGGLQIAFYNPMKGIFTKPKEDRSLRSPSFGITSMKEDKGMGLGAGGKMAQKVYPDPHGIQVWDAKKFAVVHVHIVNSELFKKITGKKPPSSPITKKDYEAYGYPWFAMYDEKYADLKAQEKLKKVKSVRQLEKGKGVKGEDEKPMKTKKVIKYDVPK